MKKNSQKTWAQTLLDCVNEWRRRESKSHEAVAVDIVEAYYSLGEPAVGGEFRRSADVFKDAKINAQRIFRWLDDRTKDCTHLPANMVPAVLKALPDDLRLAAVNEMLTPVGMSANEGGGAGSIVSSFTTILSRLCREAGEAQAAVAELTDGIAPGELERARKELQDVQSVVGGAIKQVDAAIESGAL